MRKIDNFSRFLKVAALTNAELVNFNEVARTPRFLRAPLLSTLIFLKTRCWVIWSRLFRHAASRKAYSMGKFYFFDIGVANSLAGITQVPKGTPGYGKALEHLIYLELKAYKSYKNKAEAIQFWRTYEGSEVDFVVGDSIGIEVKATEMAHAGHLKGLRNLDSQHRLKRKIVVSSDARKRVLGGNIHFGEDAAVGLVLAHPLQVARHHHLRRDFAHHLGDSGAQLVMG